MPNFIASALLILVCKEPELRVFLVKRAPDQRTFPDYWTFPGGKLDHEDGSQEETQAFLRCALRETLEETALDFSEVAADAFEDLGWRVMPPFALKRFESRYFLFEVPTPLTTYKLSPELAQARWAKPQTLIDEWKAGSLHLPPPIRGILEVLAQKGVDLTDLKRLGNNRKQLFSDLELHPGWEVVPLRTPTLPPATHTNCALVGSSQFLIVDPASPYPEEQALLLTRIAARQARGDQPLAIVLTHHHIDHMGGAKALSLALNIPIQAHAETIALLKEQFAIETAIPDRYRWNLGKDPATGQNWEVEALHTPGHAPGHLCLIDLRHRVAHVGDMLAGVGTILIEHPEGDMQIYLDSLALLEKEQLSLAIPSHGPALTRPSESCQSVRKHRLMREEKVVTALQIGSLNVETLLSQVYADTDRRVWPLARRSLLAHLHKLKNESRVSEQEDVWSLIG
jgi:endoribonuclease LACTB2